MGRIIMAAMDYVMRSGAKSVSDDEWLDMVEPLYVTAQTFVRAVANAVTGVDTLHHEVELWRGKDDGRGGRQTGTNLMAGREAQWLEEEARSIAEVQMDLTHLTAAIRTIPSPTSTEARRARAGLVQALRWYIRCARRVSKLLRDLGGKFGKSYARGGVYETRWTAIETASLKRLVGSAGRDFETAARFIHGKCGETLCVEPQPILKPHSFGPSAAIEVPSAQGDKMDENCRQGGEHGCLDKRAEVDRLNCPALFSDSAEDAEPLPVSGHLGSGASAGRRDMVQKSLLQQLEEVASRVRSLEREKSESDARMQALEREKTEAVARAQALEREVGEMAAFIAQIGAKVEEILQQGTTADTPQPPPATVPPTPMVTGVSQPAAVNAPLASMTREQLGEFSADPRRKPKRLLPHALSLLSSHIGLE